MKPFEFLSAEELDLRIQINESSVKHLGETAYQIMNEGEDETAFALVKTINLVAKDCEEEAKTCRKALEADYWDYFPPK